MEKSGNDDRLSVCPPEAINVTAEATYIQHHVHIHDESVTERDIQEAVASQSNCEPDEIIVQIPGDNRGSGRVFGFSKWNVSWQPRGPKGNPNLN